MFVDFIESLWKKDTYKSIFKDGQTFVKPSRNLYIFLRRKSSYEIFSHCED